MLKDKSSGFVEPAIHFFLFFFLSTEVCQAGVKGVNLTSGPKRKHLTFPSNSEAWMIYGAIFRFLSCIFSLYEMWTGT